MGNILIQNGLVIDTEWARHLDVLIEGSKIKRVAKNIKEEDLPDDTVIVHADGLCVLPGLIDAHTHYHLVSRGTVTADSFIEGSRLASFGGVTTVIDFADDNKTSLSSSLLERKREMKDMAIDYALHQGVYKYRDTLEEELKEIKKLGVKAIKLFTTYKEIGYFIENREELYKVFEICKKLDLLVCVHCEDNDEIEKSLKEWKGSFLPKAHAELRSAEAEAKAIEMVSQIALELDMSVYIVHLSSEKGLDKVREYREKGANIIIETTPTYLFLEKKLLSQDDGSLYIMTPPLRTQKDNVALQEALTDGEIQVVATDHCAFKKEDKLKSKNSEETLPGIPGTEELLPLMHTFGVVNGNLNLSQIVNLLSTTPAKEFGLYPRKGILREGSDADVVLFDPDQSWILKSQNLHSSSGYTAYENFSVTGKVIMTYLRGRLVMGDGIYLGLKGDGRFIEANK